MTEFENEKRRRELHAGCYDGLLDPRVFEHRMDTRRALRGYRTDFQILMDVVLYLTVAFLVLVIVFAIVWSV